MMWILTVLAGLLVGLLINYLADVLPRTRRLSRPECSHCAASLPLIKYVFSLRCPECGQRRPWRHFIVLVGGVAASLLLWFYPFAGLSYWAALPVLAFLGLILVIDIGHRLVLFETSLFGLALCGVYGVILRGWAGTLLGGLAGFGIMFFFFILGIGFNNVVGRLRGKKVGEVAFGFGDVFAGAFLGLLTGWPGVTGVILLAMLAFGAFAIVFLLVLILARRYQAFASPVPFTPFLILGTIVMFYL